MPGGSYGMVWTARPFAPARLADMPMKDLNIMRQRLQRFALADADVVLYAAKVTVWGGGSSCSAWPSCWPTGPTSGIRRTPNT